jgi:hypothetical protein
VRKKKETTNLGEMISLVVNAAHRPDLGIGAYSGDAFVGMKRRGSQLYGTSASCNRGEQATVDLVTCGGKTC